MSADGEALHYVRDLVRQCLIEADGGNGEARIRGNSCV